MNKNVVRGLVVINGCRDDLLIEWRLPRSLGEIPMPDLRHGWIKACQLKRRSVCAIAYMMPDGKPFVNCDHLFKEIFMIPSNQDHSLLLHEPKDEVLHLYRFLPAVEDIAQNDQLVRLGLVEIPRLIQCFMKFRIKAVNIGGDVVFHRFKRTASRLSVCMWR